MLSPTVNYSISTGKCGQVTFFFIFAIFKSHSQEPRAKISHDQPNRFESFECIIIIIGNWLRDHFVFNFHFALSYSFPAPLSQNITIASKNS